MTAGRRNLITFHRVKNFMDPFTKGLRAPAFLRLVAAFVLAGAVSARAGFERPGLAHLTPDVDAERDLQPLRSAAPEGVGPLALPCLHQEIVGTARVFGGKRPDLFLAAGGKADSLCLFRWLRDTLDGTPVFAPPLRVESPYANRGTIVQTADGAVHALWIVKRTLVHTRFDTGACAFRKIGELSLDALPAQAQSVAAMPRADGSVDLVFEVNGFSTPSRQRETNPSSVDWRPYDAAGISTAAVRYRYLVAAHVADWLHGALEDVRPISATNREVYFSMQQITPVALGETSGQGIVVGSRFGDMSFYPMTSTEPTLVLGARQRVAGPDGNVVRHPSIAPGPFAYANASGVSDLLAAGEGAVYFYRNLGRKAPAGGPMFAAPVPALQEQADLYVGTLPSPCVVDWDGDGILDVIVGNSEGFVLFCRNRGTNENPAFLPGVRLRAGGREIHVQAGYAGSVQGVQEARWGYVSPTVIDWNGDGLLDIVLGDITGDYTICLNRGSPAEPSLDPPHPIYCDGLNLHGMWRSRAAIGRMGSRLAMAIVDGDDHLHLYWQLDDYNVQDGGTLRLADGTLISVSADPGGGTGRCKLDFFDADEDGKLDLVVGDCRRAAIPNRKTGYPDPMLKRTAGTPLFLRNVGSAERPVFEHPAPFWHAAIGLVQPGGGHETGAVATRLGGGGVNLLVANEAGRLFLLHGRNLRLMTAAEAVNYAGRKNIFPASQPWR